MKVLKDDQQAQLRELLERLIQDGYQADEGDMSELAFWATELKPKRIRRKLAEALDVIQS